MEGIDLNDFKELLAMQTERNLNNAETTPTPQIKVNLKEYIKLQEYEKRKIEIESKLKPEDLPPNYFFCALAEMILSDD